MIAIATPKEIHIQRSNMVARRSRLTGALTLPTTRALADRAQAPFSLYTLDNLELQHRGRDHTAVSTHQSRSNGQQ